MKVRSEMDELVFEFPKAKGIVVSGDIHGDFTQLVFKCCDQYSMTDTLIIVAGDCGFGFDRQAITRTSTRSAIKSSRKSTIGCYSFVATMIILPTSIFSLSSIGDG